MEKIHGLFDFENVYSWKPMDEFKRFNIKELGTPLVDDEKKVLFLDLAFDISELSHKQIKSIRSVMRGARHDHDFIITTTNPKFIVDWDFSTNVIIGLDVSSSDEKFKDKVRSFFNATHAFCNKRLLLLKPDDCEVFKHTLFYRFDHIVCECDESDTIKKMFPTKKPFFRTGVKNECN